MILPDMKWDKTTLSSFYLLAIAQDRTIRSLRDLRKQHVPLLQGIRDEATRIAQEKYGLRNGSLRMYIHYQPSYCTLSFCPSIRCFILSLDHFHVHIVNANYMGLMGMAVGQAHLLDDVISLRSSSQLELEPDQEVGTYEFMTLTYGLGDQHGLYEHMMKASTKRN
jgi:m7GpppX diphosphatase